jgi:dTDP-glucose 4,6-dehydratase
MNVYLVTGGYGFIGSHVIDRLIETTSDFIINIDKCGVGSDKKNQTANYRITNYEFDIADKDRLFEVIKKHMPNFIIHCAAESHVDRSITSPECFINSNIVGTFNILEAIRTVVPRTRLLHVSTDEVYGHLGINAKPFTEITPVAPRSPYSASKAASDLLVLSYKTTYNIDATVTRCCNNYGSRQHDEKLIPTIIRSIVNGDKVPIYGKGNNIREWVNVTDHAKAILEVLHHHSSRDVLNIYGKRSTNNIELVNLILTIIKSLFPQYYTLEKLEDYYKFVEDRLGHDFRYAIDTIYNCVDSLSHQVNFDLGLAETITYYINKYEQSK